MKNEVEVASLNAIYRKLSELLGTETMLLIYQKYRGLQMTPPKHLYDPQKVTEIIQRECNGKNIHEFVERYGYSEKWVGNVWHKYQN